MLTYCGLKENSLDNIFAQIKLILEIIANYLYWQLFHNLVYAKYFVLTNLTLVNLAAIINKKNNLVIKLKVSKV